MRAFDIYGHLPEVVLYVRIVNLVLCSDVVKSVVVGCFCGAQKRGGVVWNETRLPAFLEILARVADEIFVGNERVAEVDMMARGCTHANRIPPRGINLDTRVR